MTKNSLIYIAGHTGMVGSAVLRKFRDSGYKNVVLRTRDELNLLNQNRVMKFFNDVRPEFVIDCAARVGGIKANSTYPADFLYENMRIQNNLIWYSHVFKVKKFLFLGSSCVYPLDSTQPMKEGSILSGKFVPSNEGYAVAKVSGIKFCEKIRAQYVEDFISCMPTNVYGYNDSFDPENSHVIPALIRKFHEAKERNDQKVVAWGTGSPRREFLFVDDLADAILFLMENPSKYDLVNIGSGKEVTIKELTETISEVVDYSGEISWDTSKPDGSPRKLLDVGRLAGMGWVAGTNLKEGLQKTYNWFLENEVNE